MVKLLVVNAVIFGDAGAAFHSSVPLTCSTTAGVLGNVVCSTAEATSHAHAALSNGPPRFHYTDYPRGVGPFCACRAAG